MELIVISDLHLSGGYDEKTGKYSRNEDFFFDDQFERFLKHLQPPDSSVENPTTEKHLIIAGDMFDFLQVDGDKVWELFEVEKKPELDELRKKEMKKKLIKKKERELYKKWKGAFKNNITKSEKKYGLGTEVDKTKWKLGIIAKGHEKFFTALGNFVSEKNCISIITGNHDIELYWPKVQDAIKEEILKYTSGSKANIAKRIHFYPWFYYDKKYNTYIEHGNQYDSLNSFEYFLCPLLEPKPEEPEPEKPKLEEPKHKGPLWLPFGSFFVRYFFNKLEVNNPFADNIKPLTKYVEWVWKEHKWELLKVICHNLPTMYFMFKKRKKFSETERNILDNKNKETFDKCSKDFTLDLNVVEGIYHLRTLPFTRKRLSKISFFLSTILFVVTIFIIFVFLMIRLFICEISIWTILSPLGLLIYPVVKWIYRKYIQKDFFEENETKIKEIKQKLGVQTIVFGHTHDPEIRKIDEDCWYVNTGTWTTIFSEEERIIREAKQFAFVRIKEGGKEPELLRWNDCLEKEERLILFEEKNKNPDKE